MNRNHFTLTSKAHSALSANCEPVPLRVVCGTRIPVSNRIPPANQTPKGLHLRWGMYKREKRTERANERVLKLVKLLVDVWRPYDFTPDGRQIVWLADYLNEQGPEPAA